MTINESLHALFLVDQQVRGLESRLDGARRHVRVQQIKIDQLTQQRDEILNQLKQAQAHGGSLENEISAIDERIDKLRSQMNTAKTNKEYSAFLVEVNTFKAEKGKLEDQLLEQMSRVEGFQAELQAIEQQLAEQQRIKLVADKELDERTAEVSEQLNALKADREKAADAVNPEPLSVFERLVETYEGEAMAPVIEEDRRRMEYTCGGCYMQIPVEKVNLLATQDVLVRCPSCSRILFLESELKASMAGKG